MSFTSTVGFTVIVKLVGVPSQETLLYVYVGVTSIVVLIGAVVVFVAVNAEMLPVAPSVAVRPTAGLLFVHAYVTVAPSGNSSMFVLNATASVSSPLHTVWSSMLSIATVGFTVIVNEQVNGTGEQLFIASYLTFHVVPCPNL